MTRPARSWKAKLAMIVAAGVIASHIMACVESPMSFSPTGTLVFSIWDRTEEPSSPSINVFRVMTLERDKTLREIERSETHILGGPVFSPDATQIAYLRIPIPLIEEEEAVVIVEPVPDTEVTSQEAIADDDTAVVSPETAMEEETVEPEIVAGNRPFDFPVDWEDLPNATIMTQSELADAMRQDVAFVDAELVFRDVANGALVDKLPFPLPILDEGTLAFDYYFSKLAFNPQATEVFFAAQGLIFALDFSERKARVLGTALRAALSPDGSMLVGYEAEGELLSLYATDATRAVHIGPAHDIETLSEAFWMDDITVAVLGIGDGKTYLDTYDANGVLQASRMLVEESFNGGSVSLSPDGRFLALVTDEDVTFFSDKFIVLEQFEHELGEDFFDAAVYTPDSQQVAFKHLVTEELGEDGPEVVRTDAIVFFTPQGRELFRVDIPPVPINLPVETDEETENDTATGEPQQ